MVPHVSVLCPVNSTSMRAIAPKRYANSFKRNLSEDEIRTVAEKIAVLDALIEVDKKSMGDEAVNDEIKVEEL